MGLGTYLSDRLFGQDQGSKRDDKLKREQLFMAYYPELSKQYNPQELASMQRRFVEGEGLNLPSMRSEPIPQEEGVDVSERSTLKPIIYETPQEAYYDTFTKQLITPESLKLPKGTRLKTFSIKPKEGENVDVMIADTETGTLKKVGQAKKGSRVINKPKDSSGGPKTIKDFQDQAALGVLKNYFTLEATGQDLENFRPSAISAAKRFGMTIEQAKEDPNFIQRLFGQEGDAVEKPSFTQPGIRSNNVPRGTKKLTKETALQFLQKANGDKELARKLAREAGYSF